jgi:hypothetical protein
MKTACLIVLLAPAVAFADGAVITKAELGADRAQLEREVAAARAADPQAFAAVRAVDAYRPAGYKRFRNPRPAVVGLVFRRLGARALWPLVELAALNGPDLAGLTAEEARALKVGALDALGVQRRAELLPLFAAAMKPTDLDVATTAAIGLGRLGERGASLLLTHARAGDPLAVAAVRGLGAGNTRRGAERLATLDTHGDAALEAARLTALREAALWR